MKKAKVLSSILLLTLSTASFVALPVEASAAYVTDISTSTMVTAKELTNKDKIAEFIKEKGLDASVYIFPSENGYLNTIAYYESDTETYNTIKSFMQENNIPEDGFRFKAYKGEKPEGGMIKDYAVIIKKLKSCIIDGDLPADLIIWVDGKEYNYTAYLRGKSPGYKYSPENVQAVIVKYEWTDSIVPETVDALLEKENIDPSFVQYFILKEGSEDVTTTSVTTTYSTETSVTTTAVISTTTAKESHQKCDFNSDSLINGDDVLAIVERYSEIAVGRNDIIDDQSVRENVDKNADVNSDNIINNEDAVLLLDFIKDNNIVGDINCDGKLDARDASSVLSFYARQSTDYYKENEWNIGSDYAVSVLGDYDKNGTIDARDASAILKAYAVNSVTLN